ncbi:hypothetical protein F6X40_09295 [Paraburkholderia sp. UCT31]|uniref:hypothetical protein n=1 Tax=Paraburkholderia sp. UCT31 TaxID=2615209 RepID=UPI001654E2DD|nr:hypothetical protein [Paraburkholderia sp. UCT31]MBC8737002.1 hypothetical protein [Paraburkholderia sp. UCT31]
MNDVSSTNTSEQSLFSLALKARVASAHGVIADIVGESAYTARMSHRADAWQHAEKAGYYYGHESIPNLLANEVELSAAWYEGIERREKEEQAKARERAKAEADALVEQRIAARDWTALGLPTPAELVLKLGQREEVSVEGHSLTYDEGFVWYTNPYGQDGIACEGLDEKALDKFLCNLARGVEYGALPY